MTTEFFTTFLAWCTLVNLVILVLWWLILLAVGGWMRRLHGKWFGVGEEALAATHYTVLAHFKVLWVIFNLTPYLVLRLFV